MLSFIKEDASKAYGKKLRPSSSLITSGRLLSERGRDVIVEKRETRGPRPDTATRPTIDREGRPGDRGPGGCPAATPTGDALVGNLLRASGEAPQ